MGFVVRHRRWLVVVVPYLYGFLTGLLPSPDEVGRFWVSNLAAPYVLLPLVAAWLLRADRAPVRLLLVPASALATVLGFYRFHTWGLGTSPSQLDMPLDSSRLEVWWASQKLLWRTFTLGNAPWATIAVVLGLVLVVVTWRLTGWGWSFASLAGAALLVLEPLLYLAGFNPFAPGVPVERTPANVVLWSGVAVAGAAAFVVLARRHVARGFTRTGSGPAPRTEDDPEAPRPGVTQPG